MAKEKAVAYKPFGNVEEVIPIIESVSNLEISNYQDSGIEYKGYGRVKTGNNQFKLLKQEPFIRNLILSWTASSAALSLTISEQMPKRLFLKNIVVQSFSDVTCYYRVYDSDKVLFRAMARASATQQYISECYFDAPVEIVGTSVYVRPYDFSGAPVAVTGSCLITLNGFWEDKS